jgi:hypothetical protein
LTVWGQYEISKKYKTGRIAKGGRMYLKKITLVLVAMVLGALLVDSVKAETPLEQYYRRTDQYKTSVDQYKGSVDDLLGAVRQNEELVRQQQAELSAREQRLAQKEADLVYREFHYPYRDGYATICGWYPAWWAWPSWWEVGLPSYGYPVYGRANCGWDRHKQEVVINNFTVANGVDQRVFGHDVRRAFGSSHGAPNWGNPGHSGHSQQVFSPPKGSGHHGDLNRQDGGIPGPWVNSGRHHHGGGQSWQSHQGSHSHPRSVTAPPSNNRQVFSPPRGSGQTWGARGGGHKGGKNPW